ncbi:Rossmann-like and DUF2520 domain-containing protein [Phosphitispora fastidiosa]|uniref:Rossmann-like and DUF2520 domain-containing protein n=1 Tax=Phosphitispora fastidiosa TaxID=2837202 RepID=UPI001E6142E7|nr:Rossmann-like and DUF2520 domain-containing protein [Phosphitispora fastidiosa]MBU7007825.1 putative short-subunit dehydrogenase-like oxidoreductase (DUF2520 family) [Phosphitispora fastidiosa]
MYRIGVIGTGVVGSAVAILLQDKGHQVTGMYSKTGISAVRLAERLGCRAFTDPVQILNFAEVIFITTPDRELNQVASLLAASGMVRGEHRFFHMSGVQPAAVLAPLSEKGGVISSLHPLQSFAGIEQALVNLPGSFFTVQGDAAAMETAYRLISDLEGEPFTIKEEDKPLYHLGAVIASNYLVALMHYAIGIFGSIGIPEGKAIEALLPLIKGTLSNIAELGPVKSLTGPVARGDSGTVGGHLKALSKLNYSYMDLYKTLGRYTVEIALEKGSIDETQRERLLKLFCEGAE